MSVYKYWTICKVDGRFHRSSFQRGYQASELPVVKKQFQAWFPSYCETQELLTQEDKEIQTQLLSWFLRQDSRDFESSVPPSWVIAGLSLRCYVSHAIQSACQTLAQKFGQRYGFSPYDLLPIVLTDDGKASIKLDSDRKTQLILDRFGNRFFGTCYAKLSLKCQNNKALILKLSKFLNPNPQRFNTFNRLLIPSTTAFVVFFSNRTYNFDKPFFESADKLRKKWLSLNYPFYQLKSSFSQIFTLVKYFCKLFFEFVHYCQHCRGFLESI